MMMSGTMELLREEALGWAWTFGICALCFLCHVCLPPFVGVPGYAQDPRTGETLRYRYNGLASLIAVLAVCYVVCVNGMLPPASDLAQRFWPAARGGCFLGLLLSTILYCRGRKRMQEGLVDRGASCPTVSAKRSVAAAKTAEFDARGTAEHFYCGVEWNPRTFFDVDIKMFNYLVGAVMLACNVASALALHLETRSVPSYAMSCYTLMMLWFIVEYLYHEHVHTFTYDIFRERTGLKMCWGCWCFYPFFYPIGIWACVDSTIDVSLSSAILIGALFLTGWSLTRGANLQKFYHRTGQAWWLMPKNSTVPGSSRRLLCSGFWGVSRHVNYFGEIIQGLALALPGVLVGNSWLPLLYPLYYILLFVGREQDDDVACAEKYGAAWTKYKRLVPYKIVPAVY